jgi:carboxynorspermidine decarboxylase
MVKTTMFNGVKHPSIIIHENGEFKTVREFTYEDFKHRLG